MAEVAPSWLSADPLAAILLRRGYPSWEVFAAVERVALMTADGIPELQAIEHTIGFVPAQERERLDSTTPDRGRAAGGSGSSSKETVGRAFERIGQPAQHRQARLADAALPMVNGGALGPDLRRQGLKGQAVGLPVGFNALGQVGEAVFLRGHGRNPSDLDTDWKQTLDASTKRIQSWP